MTQAVAAPPEGGREPHPQHTDVPASGRVVLVDPREERRALMGVLVGQSPGLTVVGTAGTLSQAIDTIRAEGAGAAVVEIQMPVPEGLEAVAGLRREFPDLRIVVCSFHDEAATREAARSQGADSYLTKPVTARDLRDVVEVEHLPG